MKKTVIQKYHSQIEELEQKSYYLLHNNLITDTNLYRKVRVDHYKLSNLLHVIIGIKDKTPIVFNSQSIFFDFPYIKMTLTEFSIEEQFKLFEIMLRRYIEEFESVPFESYKMYYGIFLYADILYKNHKTEVDIENTLSIIQKLETIEEKLKKMHETCLRQCCLLKQFFTSSTYNQEEISALLLSLGISEPFVHYFIRYTEKKKWKNLFIPEKFIKYAFENSEFINFTTKENDLQKEKRLRTIFNKYYSNATEKINNDQTLYLTIYKNLFNTLKGNFGLQFVGFYEIVFFELNHIKANQQEIYNILIRTILNDIQFLSNHPTYKCRNEEYEELKNTLKSAFPLQSFNENLDEDKIRASLMKISFPEEYLDQFILLMKKDYYTQFNKRETPYKNITEKPVVKKEVYSYSPFPKKEQKTNKKELTMRFLNEKEQLIYWQVLDIMKKKDSLIEGYIGELEKSIQIINEAVELVEDTPNGQDFARDCIKEEIETINGILENISLLNTYKHILKPKEKYS